MCTFCLVGDELVAWLQPEAAVLLNSVFLNETENDSTSRLALDTCKILNVNKQAKNVCTSNNMMLVLEQRLAV